MTPGRSRALTGRVEWSLRLLVWVALVQAACATYHLEAADWPQWHGPRRDNISTETGLLKQWPSDGPQLQWTATGCGEGYSSVSIAGGLLFTAGVIDNQTYVLAFDLDGRPKWKSLNGEKGAVLPPRREWGRPWSGAKSTPTVDDGLVYHLNEVGRLAGFDAQGGNQVWAVDVMTRFKAVEPVAGYAESVLVVSDKVICYPGGTDGSLVALDKKTGKVVWANTEIGDQPSYSSPILVEDNGVRQIVAMSARAVFGVEADTGRLLWRSEHVNRDEENVDTPIYHEGCVFVSSGYGRGADMLRPTFGGTAIGVDKAWSNERFGNLHGGTVLLDGRIYGVSYDARSWCCLEVRTGQLQYRGRGLGETSLTYADGMLYCLGDRGTMALVPPSPDGFEPVSRFELPSGGRGPYWAHPVVCGGRLYVRHADRVFAYDVRAK